MCTNPKHEEFDFRKEKKIEDMLYEIVLGS